MGDWSEVNTLRITNYLRPARPQLDFPTFQVKLLALILELLRIRILRKRRAKTSKLANKRRCDKLNNIPHARNLTP